MCLTRVLVIAVLVCDVAALLRSKHIKEDPDHLLHEVVDNADHGNAPKPTSPHQKEFASLDRNADGKLSSEELMWRQYATGCEPSEAYVRSVDYMYCGDKDKDGAITSTEFEASMSDEWTKCVMGKAARRTHGFMHFIEADADIDDKLSLTELRGTMTKIWGQAGAQLAKPFMICADRDGDQMINQTEFHDTISVYNPAARKFQGPNTAVLTCLDKAMVAFDADLAFSATDTNKDNKISKSEAYEVMSMMQAKIAQPKAEAIFAAADLNKDNYLSKEEFVKAGESYAGEGENSFLLANAGAPAALAAGASKVGMGAACAARPEAPWSFFSSEMPTRNITRAAEPLKVQKALVATNTSKMLSSAKLGPFDDLVAACKYCAGSFTKSKVVPRCICTAYSGDDGPTMFCTATPAGLKYAASKGGCQCNAKNMQQMGATTCDPF